MSRRLLVLKDQRKAFDDAIAAEQKKQVKKSGSHLVNNYVEGAEQPARQVQKSSSKSLPKIQTKT